MTKKKVDNGARGALADELLALEDLADNASMLSEEIYRRVDRLREALAKAGVEL